jgi:tripartite ATP-independent transporter DctM subunit
MTLRIILVVGMALLGLPLFCGLASLGLLGGAHAHADLHGQDLYQFLGGAIEDVYRLAGPEAVSLSTIPLFTFAGYLMASAKSAQRLIKVAEAVVGWIPGGLALMTLWTCAFFTTFTGASGVTIVALGGLILPALEKARYGKRFSLEVVTGSGAVGLLFPPSLPLIVYGIIFALTAGHAGSVETPIEFSIERFLFAGIVPGLILLALLSIYCVVEGWRSKVPRAPFAPWKLACIVAPPVGVVWGWVVDPQFRADCFALIPEALIPAIVLVPLTSGVATIPESAAITALYVFAIEVFYYKDIDIKRQLLTVARESMTLVGAIFVKIAGATILTWFFVDSGVPEALFAWLGQYVHSAWTFLLVMNVILLLVGCLMDIFSAIVVVVPLIVPAAATYHIDPYHLGVIFLLNLEIGYLLPPAGLNLFIAAFRFNRPITELYRAVVPFILIMVVALLMVTYVPKLTVVPEGRKPVAAEVAAPEPAP